MTGCLGNTAANGTWTITVLNDSTVQLNGSAGNGAYTGGGYASCPGSNPHYEQDDDNPKGEFLVIQWKYNNRDLGEFGRVVTGNAWGSTGCGWNRTPPPGDPYIGPTTAPRTQQQTAYGLEQAVTDILAWTDCTGWSLGQPVCLVCSPNSQDAPAYPRIGKYSSMPPPTPDERYPGWLWVGGYVQHIPDPLWTTPAVGCCALNTSGVVTYIPSDCAPAQYFQDGGLCVGDSSICFGHDAGASLTGFSIYYQHAPMIEARNGTPTINGLVPVSRVGVSLSILTPQQLDAASEPAGILIPPFSIVGIVKDTTGTLNTPETPWGLYLKELGCVCTNGRYGTPYSQNGTLC